MHERPFDRDEHKKGSYNLQSLLTAFSPLRFGCDTINAPLIAATLVDYPRKSSTNQVLEEKKRDA